MATPGESPDVNASEYTPPEGVVILRNAQGKPCGVSGWGFDALDNGTSLKDWNERMQHAAEAIFGNSQYWFEPIYSSGLVIIHCPSIPQHTPEQEARFINRLGAQLRNLGISRVEFAEWQIQPTAPQDPSEQL